MPNFFMQQRHSVLISVQVCLDVQVSNFTLPAPVGPTEVCPNVLSTYEMTDVLSCDQGQSFYWSLTNGEFAAGSPTDSVIGILWIGQDSGEICLNHILGSDTIPHCMTVHILGEMECLPVIGSSCDIPVFLCGGLDGFSATLDSMNLVQPFEACSSYALNNPDWYAFVAGSSTISMQVVPSNCQGSQGLLGMQAAIYADCGLGVGGNPLATQCECTNSAFMLSSSQFVLGQTYYIVFDGCGGGVCDFTVEVMEGVTACFLNIIGPTTVCNGDAVVYGLQNNFPQSYTIEWLQISNAACSIMGDSISVVWDTSFTGTAQVCASITDSTLMAMQVCLDVQVNTFTLPDPVGPIDVCPNVLSTYGMTEVQTCDQGQSFYWSLTNGEFAAGSPTSSVVGVLWIGQDSGDICLNHFVGTDTIPHCMSVHILGEIECLPVIDYGSTCDVAVLLCNGLDGFSATLDSVNLQQPLGGCPTNILNNPDWYAFVAGSSSISIQVEPSNCQGTFNRYGMQAAIYADCGIGFGGNPLALQCECTDSAFMLTSLQFVPGQTYYIVFDGCAGDICDFTVDVVEGITTGLPNIAGPTFVCSQDTVVYTLNTPFSAIYSVNWKPIQGANINLLSDGISIQVLWDSLFSGPTQVCATISDTCEQAALVCLDVEVTELNLPDPVGPVLVCQYEQSIYQFSDLGSFCHGFGHFWSVSNGVLLTEPTALEAEVAWLGDSISEVCLHFITNPSDTVIKCLSIVFLPAESAFCFPCDSVWVEAGEFVINCTTTSTPDMIVGTTNLPEAFATYQWTLNGVVVSTTDTVIIESLGQYVFTVTHTANGCAVSDTFQFIEDLDVPIAFAGQDMVISCINPEVVLDGSGSSTGPAFIYLWEGPSIIEPNLNPTVSEPGIYTLTVVNVENGCSATDEVEVLLLIVEISIFVETTPDSCQTNSGTASLIAVGFNPSIQWSTGETTNTITGLAAGNYGATVTHGFCESHVSVTIDSVACTSTSEVFTGAKFQVLPNPNNGQFSVLMDVASPIQLELELVDVKGHNVATLEPMKQFGKGQHRLDFRQDWLPSGTYFLVIKNEKGRMGMKVEVLR